MLCSSHVNSVKVRFDCASEGRVNQGLGWIPNYLSPQNNSSVNVGQILFRSYRDNINWRNESIAICKDEHWENWKLKRQRNAIPLKSNKLLKISIIRKLLFDSQPAFFSSDFNLFERIRPQFRRGGFQISVAIDYLFLQYPVFCPATAFVLHILDKR